MKSPFINDNGTFKELENTSVHLHTVEENAYYNHAVFLVNRL